MLKMRCMEKQEAWFKEWFQFMVVQTKNIRALDIRDPAINPEAIPDLLPKAIELDKRALEDMGPAEDSAENIGLIDSQIRQEMPQKQDQKPPLSLLCVTTLYQQETFPLLYIQKNTGWAWHKKMALEVQMILRTNYEGRDHEAACLQKIETLLDRPYIGKKTQTMACFFPKSLVYKSGDKKLREVILTYDVRVVFCPEDP